MPLFFHENIPLGLDISDFKLRLVQLAKNGKHTKLISFSEIDVPHNIIIDGLVQQPKKLIELIENLKENIQGARLKTKKIIVGLPEKQSFIKMQPFNYENKEIILKEISRHLPYKLENVYLDYKYIESFFPDSSGVHFSASQKILIDNYLAIFNEADLYPEALEVETESIARCLLPPTEKNTYLIVDIGLARTTISITYNSLIIFSISFDSIIKKDKAYFSDLVNNVNKVIDFSMQHLSYIPKISAIITCGTGAYIENLSQELGNKYKIKCFGGDPWLNLKSSSSIIKKIEHPLSYTTAIGLALRATLNKNYI